MVVHPRALAALNAAVVTSCLISHCATTIARFSIALIAVIALVTSISWFAPGIIMILFSPSPSTQIWATPLGVELVSTNFESIPTLTKLSAIAFPNTSSPNFPMKCT